MHSSDKVLTNPEGTEKIVWGLISLCNSPAGWETDLSVSQFLNISSGNNIPYLLPMEVEIKMTILKKD